MSTANTLTSGLDCASPESIMEPTNRTQAGDQYSFGCILYYCLSGRYPFPDGTAVEKMMAHQFKQPTALRDAAPGIPDGLSAIVERLMQKSPDGRYAGVDEVVEALLPFAPESGRRGSTGGHHGGQRSAAPAPPPAAITVSGSRYESPPLAPSRFDAAPLPPSRFDSGPPPLAPSRFDSIPGSRPGAPHPPASKPAPVASTQFPTPPAEPLTPVPKSSPFGASRFGAEPARPALPTARPAPPTARPAPPTARPAPPPAPPPPTRSTLARPAPEAPRAIPVATRVAQMDLDDDIPEALPVDEPAPRSRIPRIGRSAAADWDAPRKATRVSMFLLFLITAVVTTGVYLVGKIFIFD